MESHRQNVTFISTGRDQVKDNAQFDMARSLFGGGGGGEEEGEAEEEE